MNACEDQVIRVNAVKSLRLAGKTLGGCRLNSKLKFKIDADDQHGECVCPYCRRTLNMEVHMPTTNGRTKPARSPPVLASRDHAYVALMYGHGPAYFVGALVTGLSLQKHTKLSKQDRVLLCTSDVPESFRVILSQIWTVRSVDYIEGASPWFYWDYHRSRFKQVFTKLRVLKDLAGEYRKVILLDLDLLIRREDIDSLFDLRAPAAMVRGQNYLPHGSTVPIDTFYNSHRQTVGINCGVMMVEPSADIFDLMLSEVTEHYKHPEHWPSHGPEQDYLSRFYNAFNQWTNVSCRFNYQVHLMKFGSLEWHHYNRKGFRDVSVFHFSGRLVKPWEILLDLLIVHEMTYDEVIKFVETIPNRLTNNPNTETDDAADDPFVIESTHFCYGNSPGQRPTKRCYLHRFIHPSWTPNDSDAVIEWIHAFQRADEDTNGETVVLLHSIWEEELRRREGSFEEISL